MLRQKCVKVFFQNSKTHCLEGQPIKFLNVFLLGFSHIKYEYIIENWVWLRWLGLELGLQNAAGPLNFCFLFLF